MKNKPLLSSSSPKSISPWQRPQLHNLFRYELSTAAQAVKDSTCIAHPVFAYIHKNKINNLFYKALATFAPLVPVCSPPGRELFWVSPSASHSTVFIVIGKDSSGAIRLVGGNMFTAPNRRAAGPRHNFFDEYDLLNDRYSQERYIREAIESKMGAADHAQVAAAARDAEKFGVRSIYVLVLDGDKAHTAISHAVVGYRFPVDQSCYDKLGEVTL